MAKRLYLGQDKHTADQIRKFIKEHRLRTEVDGTSHIRITDCNGKFICTVPGTGQSGRGSRTGEFTMKRLKRGLGL